MEKNEKRNHTGLYLFITLLMIIFLVAGSLLRVPVDYNFEGECNSGDIDINYNQKYNSTNDPIPLNFSLNGLKDFNCKIKMDGRIPGWMVFLGLLG